MQSTYVENFYDPPRRRYAHNDEIVCAVPSCNCKPDPLPKSYKDKVGVQAGKQLYKAFCPNFDSKFFKPSKFFAASSYFPTRYCV